MRNRATSVRFPVFNGYTIRVILSRNVPRTAGRLGAGTGHCIACFIRDDVESNRRAWLVLPVEPDAGTVAHEAAHAVRELFRFTGVRNDDETFAYHLDFLVGRVHKFVGRQR